MSSKIAIKIAQAIEKAKSAFIYQNICERIAKVLCELRDRVSDFQSEGNEELDSILLQLNNLFNIIDSFDHKNWLQASLQVPIEDLLTNISQIMDSLIGSLEKIGVKLTNKYDPSNENIYNDLSNLYGKLSDNTKPEIKSKLDEINRYISKIGKPLLVTIRRIQCEQIRKSDDEINTTDSSDSSDDDEEEEDEEYGLNEVDQRFNFHKVDKYKIQQSDYIQYTKPVISNRYYTIYKGRMKLSKEKVTIMVLNYEQFTEERFNRFINVLTALKHPNLDSFVGYVESPTHHAIVTRRKGEKLSTILRRQSGQEIDQESDSENDEKSDENDENNSENDEINSENDTYNSENNEINSENDTYNSENNEINSENDRIDVILDSVDDTITLKPGYRTIIAFQIASTMSYLHSLKIAHRDLCTDNVTIDEDLNPRITNFATSRFMPEDLLSMTHSPVSIAKFVAPEINSAESYSEEVDVFSFGGILYELLTDQRPFYEIVHPDFEHLIRNKKRPTLPKNISEKLKKLIESCWAQKPSERPIFANIVQQMLDDSISFPQDENSDVLKQFYASKKIKNVDLKICFNLIKSIQEDKDVYVYKEEVARIRSLLKKYQHILQTSEYAKQESIEDFNANIQITNMKEALENLLSTLKQIEKKTWLSIALITPSFEIPDDLNLFMEQIYICFKSMNFKVQKYKADKNDLKWDFRFIYSHYQDIYDCDEADLRREEIENFMVENDFELTASSEELTETFKNILSEWKNYELNKSDFQIKMMPLGQGVAGKVYEGTQNSTGKKVAVKKLYIDDLVVKDQLKLIKREIATLVQLDNDYLIHFVGFVNEPGECLWIISELIKGDNLFKANFRKRLKPFQKTKIAFEIAQGMEYLKSKDIVHRDLKTPNILLDGNVKSNDIKPKICDFGFSRIDMSLKMSTRTGTLHYMAPEVIKGECYDFKADVFSYGMVLWELYAGEPPFYKYSPEEAEDLIKNNTPLNYPDDKFISPDLKQLIEDATNYEPSKRPSFTEIINRMLDNRIAFAGANPDQISAFYEQKAIERNS